MGCGQSTTAVGASEVETLEGGPASGQLSGTPLRTPQKPGPQPSDAAEGEATPGRGSLAAADALLQRAQRAAAGGPRAAAALATAECGGKVWHHRAER